MSLRFVAWDVDGVLTEEHSSWDFILRESGFENECEKNKQLFFSGKIDYKTWAEMDIALLKGVSRREIMQIIDKIKTREGIPELLEDLQKNGVHNFIISAGIDLIAQRFRIPSYINRVLFDDNDRVSGIDVICGLENKDVLTQKAMSIYGVKREEAAAVGDSSWDIPMFNSVRWPIAFMTEKQEVIENSIFYIDSVEELRRTLLSLL